MSDDRPTYEIAAPYIAPYVQPIWQGALAMPFESRDEDGRRLSLADDHLSGHHLLLVFLNDSSDATAIPVLKALADRQPQIDGNNCTVIAMSGTSDATHNKALKRVSGFCWPIASDSTGAIFASYGLHKENDAAIRIVILTPYRQVRAWFDSPEDVETTLATIMDVLENSQAAEELRWGPPHAPVLVVPNVLSLEECGKLIESFETGAPFMVRPPRPGEIAGNYKIPVYEHDRQDRVDQIIKTRTRWHFWTNVYSRGLRRWCKRRLLLM